MGGDADAQIDYKGTYNLREISRASQGDEEIKEAMNDFEPIMIGQGSDAL